jgi:hypothetical protein
MAVPPNEMIERVARAIQKWEGEQPSKSEDGDGYSSDWHEYVGSAVAAIHAMREPTEAMLDRGAVAEGDGNLAAQARNIYAAMIDAALAPNPIKST